MPVSHFLGGLERKREGDKESERESSTFKVAFDKEINADQDQMETPTQE